MKKFFLLFCTVSLFCAFVHAQRFDINMKFDGENREFIVVKPSGAVPAGGYPVVFMFHGSSGDGEQYYNVSGWREKGEAEKFITVFPTALRYCVLGGDNNDTPIKITKWNNGNLQDEKCPGVAQDFKDDVKFIRKMVDTIRQKFQVHPGKIFASGFSNGSAMVNKLAMDAPDVFAAVAGCGGLLHPLDSLRPSRTIPVWQMVGSLDDRFTVPYGVTEFPFGGDTILAYLRKPIARMLTCEGLESSIYSKNNTVRTNTFIFNTPQTGQPANTYRFTLVDNMYHVYPNGDNYPLVAADLFWQFFLQVSMSTAVKTPNMPEAPVFVYPNPSVSDINIDATNFAQGSAVDMTVYDLAGRKIMAQSGQQSALFTLSKQDFGCGLFVVQLRTAQKVTARRIVFE